ncbi:MAG: DUF4179 domain-containing protein [Lachnospiraceae bacterium]|nr:DUF4179 domain-containing protein [Lachnospiraceae bacterium]
MTGFDLNKALTDIDERFIEEADITNTESRMKKETRFAKKGGKRVFRIALIAACVVVLLTGTVAAANRAGVLNRIVTSSNGAVNNSDFLGTIGAQSDLSELGNAYIPMGITKQGTRTVTLENIIGDADIIYLEFSTDYALDEPDGWVTHNLPNLSVDFNGTVFYDDEYEEFLYGCCGSGSAAFCRNGKLWFIYYMTSGATKEADFGRRKMKVDVTFLDTNAGSDEVFTFEWTNHYETETESFVLNKELGDWIVKGADLSLISLVIHTETEYEQDYEMSERKPISLDYVRLDDGSVWFYSEFKGVPVKHSGWGGYSTDGKWEHTWVYSLLADFSEEGSDIYKLIPFERITAVSINGTEIPLR